MRIGVLGGGQLGRMLALAGIPMGFEFRFLEPAEDAPIRGLGEHVVAGYADPNALAEFAKGLDVVTYEFENVPVAAARSLAERVPVRPSPDALATAQDRVVEKELFARLGISTAAYEAIDSEEELARALERLGTPAVAKTRRLGYDGRGQFALRGPDDVAGAWRALGGASSILERNVPFDRELSILAVGGANGERAFYPLVENRHREGILRLSLAPAPGVTQELQAAAESIAEGILKEFSYAGVLAVELFEAGGELLANELAPRVHNSGHWTIEGAQTSQFENHLRAVAGLPLGSTRATGASAMLNLIGAVPDPAEVLSEPGIHLHLYGKAPRQRRKLGHVTLRGTDAAEVARAAQALADRLPSDG
ncbi:MAG: 5-(carboxyamino)imidazole ribonucleotide synthase [Actinomycetota bacterium]|nr:5-(carboxyamino)imidazole ribonucleotide synthase [Actinomycetota bacterium]